MRWQGVGSMLHGNDELADGYTFRINSTSASCVTQIAKSAVYSHTSIPGMKVTVHIRTMDIPIGQAIVQTCIHRCHTSPLYCGYGAHL